MRQRLYINPRAREALEQRGLVTARDFLDLSGVIYCGHPDRNVARVDLGGGTWGFLKKEHRVPWRDRLANAWAGFGFVSKSWRELTMLQYAARIGLGCPEVIAAGEENGRAFLCVGAEPGAHDLRRVLRETSDPAQRRSIAARLGWTLARLHDVGLVHGDLYAKHVLLCDSGMMLLDWQRARRLRTVSWRLRRRELAALDATLGEELATPRERLAVVRAYLRDTAGRANAKRSPEVREILADIRAESERLQARRSIREQRQTVLDPGKQTLVWLDGEAICLTREFLDQLGGRVPDWLRLSNHEGPRVQRDTFDIPEVGPVRLVRRWASRPWRWLLAKLRRRTFTTPELEQAATIFRLERYGVPVPRLLGVGERFTRPWRTASFLLVEPMRDVVPLRDGWRAEHARALRETLTRIHDAGYALRDDVDKAAQFAVSHDNKIVLTEVCGLERRKDIRPAHAETVAHGIVAQLQRWCPHAA